MTDTAPKDIEADIARTRAELQATVDALSDRLNPKSLGQETLEDVKVAVADLKRRVTGDVRPAGEPEPTTKGYVALGVGALVALTVLRKIAKIF